MVKRVMRVCWVLVVGVLLLAPGWSAAEDTKAKNLYERGRFELEDGQFQAALDFLDQALALEPDNMSIQYARARALIKLDRVDEGQALLVKVLKADPQGQKAANIDLAALYARQRRFDEATTYYTRAIEAFPKRTDLYLARAAMYIETADHDRARLDLSRAVELEPSVAPAARYYESLIDYNREDFPAAIAKIDQALAMNPDADLAKQLEAFKTAMEKEARVRKPWAINAGLMYQYDDNVSLEPLDGFGVAAAGAPARDKGDSAWGGFFSGTGYLINRRRMELGATYTFRGLYYTDLTESNMVGHSLAGFYAFNKAPWYFRLPVETAFYIGDSKDKMTLFSVSPNLTRTFGANDRTTVYGAWEYKYMHDGSSDVRRWVLGGLHFHTFPLSGGRGLILRGGLQLENEDALGLLGADYSLTEVKAGLTFPLPGKFEGDVGLSHAWIDYEQNPLFDPNQSRSDDRWMVTAKLGRGLTDRLRLDLMYTHTYNDSNLVSALDKDIYEFKRNVYTLLLTGMF
ncbi:MAG: tetratricopeptide repeat protein [Proteobacteria bacterium]|nr:tetratricopeptide repeat protein [Pseudomonadota bacterium]